VGKQDEANIEGKATYVWDKETLGQSGTCSRTNHPARVAFAQGRLETHLFFDPHKKARVDPVVDFQGDRIMK
jgi:hypothetical protein